MPHDPEKVEECRSWLDRARADLDAAEILFDSGRRSDSALFHCQQAVERAWKAFLFWKDMPFRKTHDLRELGESCVRVDERLADLAGRAEDLTQFVWAFRYPGELDEPESEEVRTALAVAREVLEAVANRLPPEVIT